VDQKHVANPSKRQSDQLDNLRTKDNLRKQIDEVTRIDPQQYDSDVDSVFHSFSHNKDSNVNGERDISSENGEQALDELLRRWDINLSDKEIDIIKQKNFK
jgi:hypothetical protein